MLVPNSVLALVLRLMGLVLLLMLAPQFFASLLVLLSASLATLLATSMIVLVPATAALLVAELLPISLVVLSLELPAMAKRRS